MESLKPHPLFLKTCTFVMGVAALEQLPKAMMPEVAFIGRSNVGKSSLINALTGRKALARTSNTPGRTQQLNFFNLDNKLMLVDLPGYGYAKAPKTEVAEWQALIGGYLRGRAPLRRVCVLIDARHGLKPSDREMMEMLDIHAVSYQLVLTKSDKIKPPALVKLIAELEQERINYPAMHPQLLATSSVKSSGIADVQHALAEVAK
jgi:GTP-binding protein